MARVVRRRYLGGAAALVGGLLATACGEPTVRYVGQPQAGPAGPAGPAGAKGETGAQGAQGAQGATGAAAKPVRISFPDGWANYTMEKRLPVFEQENPSIAPIFEPTPDYHSKLAVVFAADTPADIHVFEADDAAMYAFWAAKGVLTQLDSYISRDRYDMSVFFPQVLHSLKIVDGKYWGFPYMAFMARCGLFYNIGKFEEKAIPLPTEDWTYDQMQETAEKFTVRQGSEVTEWGGGRKFGGDLALMAVLRAFGGDLYNEDGTKTLIGAKESQEAITWWFDRRLKDQVLAIDLVDNKPLYPRTMMEQGKSAFAVGYNPGDRLAVASAMNPAGARWGLVLQPKGPGGRRGGAFFNSPTGIARVSKVPDEAWELLKFFANKESAVVMGTAPPGARNTSHMGPRKDAYADPRFLAAPGMPDGVMEAVGRSMQLDEPFSFAANFMASAIEQVINPALLKALRQEVSYDTGFFENISNQIQAIMDKPRETA